MSVRLHPIRAAGAALCTALLVLLLACDSNPATSTPIAASPTALPVTATVALPATAAPVAATTTSASTLPTADTTAGATAGPSATAALPVTIAAPTDTAAPTAAPPATAAPPSDTPAPPAGATRAATTPPARATRAATAPPATRRPATRLPAPPTSAPTAAPTSAPTSAPVVGDTGTPVVGDTGTPVVGDTGTPVAGDTATPASPVATPRPPVTPSFPLPPRVPGDLSQIERVPAGKHRVAITIDAGAGTGYGPQILDALARHHTHVTFFITGQWAEQNPNQLREFVAAGNEIGNHSYSHPSFPKLTDAQMTDELTKCESIISGITGVSTKPYWRPPFGDETGHVLDVARGLGYRSIFWTWDSLDSVGKPKTKSFLVTRVTAAPIELDGAIILMHIGNETTAEALPEILDRLYARGLQVVPISELLAP